MQYFQHDPVPSAFIDLNRCTVLPLSKIQYGCLTFFKNHKLDLDFIHCLKPLGKSMVNGVCFLVLELHFSFPVYYHCANLTDLSLELLPVQVRG